MFVVGRGRALNIVLLTTCRAHVTRIRHQQHVAQVGTTCTAQVRMAETNNHTVAIMVARTPIPTLVNILRTYLDRTERHVRTHEHMAMLT